MPYRTIELLAELHKPWVRHGDPHCQISFPILLPGTKNTLLSIPSHILPERVLHPIYSSELGHAANARAGLQSNVNAKAHQF